MASHSDSDSDSDDPELEEDLDALRRACLLAGRGTSGSSGAAGDEDESGSDDDLDDVAVLNRIMQKYPNSAAGQPAMPRPLRVLLPESGLVDEEEEDLAILRDIQRRFCRKSDGETSTVLEDIRMPTAANVQHSDSSIGPSDDGNMPSMKNLIHRPFPKAAWALFDAIKKNREYQKFLKQKVIEIEAKIEENKDLQKRVKCLMDFEKICEKSVLHDLRQRREPIVRLVSSRRPAKEHDRKDEKRKPRALSLGPEENFQVAKFKMVLERYPLHFKRRPWTESERESLAKGVRQQYQERMILDLMNSESDKDDHSPVDVESALSINFILTPERMKSFSPLVNWDRLASMYLPNRSGAECESRWLNCEDPTINHSNWNAHEDKKLLLAVQEWGHFNWINISVALGTNRAPSQCLLRYQRSLNPHLLNKEWTKEEDCQLKAAVEIFGENWQLVSSILDGRAGPQCANRWKSSLNPSRNRVGRWSVEEDKRLKVAMMLFGSQNWSKVAQFIPGRTQVQCRERWLNCLDPTLNLQPWTNEEDSKLLAAINEHGYCWSKIAMCVPPRTDSQCRRRWKVLRPNEVPLLQAAKNIKRTVLMNNFVSRESERPEIGSGDLMDLIGFQGEDAEQNRSRGIANQPRLTNSRCSKRKSGMSSSAVGTSDKPDLECATNVSAPSDRVSQRSRNSFSRVRQKQCNPGKPAVRTLKATASLSLSLGCPSSDTAAGNSIASLPSSGSHAVELERTKPPRPEENSRSSLVIYNPPATTVPAGLLSSSSGYSEVPRVRSNNRKRKPPSSADSKAVKNGSNEERVKYPRRVRLGNERD